MTAKTAFDDLHIHARAMSQALLKARPLGGSEMFSKVGEEYLADPVKCGQLIDDMRRELSASRKAHALAHKALIKAESFISGFENDETQEGMPELLAEIRGATAKGNLQQYFTVAHSINHGQNNIEDFWIVVEGEQAAKEAYETIIAGTENLHCAAFGPIEGGTDHWA